RRIRGGVGKPRGRGGRGTGRCARHGAGHRPLNGIDARWFDGKSSRARDVRLRLAAPDLLEIGPVDADAPVECWPLADIAISPRLGSAPRILRRHGHGQLECADSPLLDAWFPEGGGRVERAVDWLE